MNAGSIHVGGVGNTPPLFAAAADGQFQVVQGATYGGTGDAIVVPKGSPITSVADLKGKKVGVAEGSSANYNLLAQLDEAGAEVQRRPGREPPARRRPRRVLVGSPRRVGHLGALHVPG